MFYRKQHARQDEPDNVLLRLSPHDVLTLDQGYQGIMCFGGTGAGKTTGVLHPIQENACRLGTGMLWLCAKAEEADRAVAIAEKCGREKDVRLIVPNGELKCDLLQVACAMPGGVENAAQLLETLSEVGSRKQGKDEVFFRQSSYRAFGAIIVILEHLKETLGATTMRKLEAFLVSLPVSVQQRDSAAWRDSSFAWKCCYLLNDTKDLDLQRSFAFCMDEWPQMATDTRTSILATMQGTLGRFMRKEVASVIAAGETNVHPRGLQDGEIHIWNFPQLQYQEAGQFVGVAAKALALRQLLARDVRQSPRPVMIVQDEAQLFATPKLDSMAQTVARSQRIIILSATQNIQILASALGADRVNAETGGWLANFQTLILCQNACPETAKWASELIGQHKELFISFSGNSNQQFDAVGDVLGIAETHAGCSLSQQMRPIVPPEVVPRLRQGGAPAFTVEAIVYSGGRTFSTGRAFLRCLFTQRF